MAKRPLSPTAQRHLIELLDAPYWNPGTPGEWAIARALERRGYVQRNVSRGFQAYSLTGAGRVAGEDLRDAR